MGTLTPQTIAAKFGPYLLDSAACRAIVVRASRGSAPACPSCGVAFDASRTQRLLDGKVIECSCGVSSSPRSGTILGGSTLTDRQVVFILAMLHWRIPADQIAAMAGCTRATVYNWRNRLQEIN